MLVCIFLESGAALDEGSTSTVWCDSASSCTKAVCYYVTLRYWTQDLESIFFFFQAEDGIRDYKVTGVQTCALPICMGFFTAGDPRRQSLSRQHGATDERGLPWPDTRNPRRRRSAPIARLRRSGVGDRKSVV